MTNFSGAEPFWLRLGRGLENPVFEPDVEQRRAVTGNEGALIDVDTPVLGRRVGDDPAGVSVTTTGSPGVIPWT